jgi:hypothetical protein
VQIAVGRLTRKQVRKVWRIECPAENAASHGRSLERLDSDKM